MCSMADFSKRSFLEWVSLAAREPVYSAAFAWLFSEQSPLSLAQRLALVETLSGADTAGGRAIEAYTERNHVDILLRVERESEPLFVAIENKIKAVEGIQQLANHDLHLDQLSGEVRKVFLTLTGEEPYSGKGWVSVSFSKLLKAICAQSELDNTYLADICDSLTRLVAVANASDNEKSRLVAAAFKDQNAQDKNEIISYMKDMRLETVVQRIWMTELAVRLNVNPPWQKSIGETHGQALLNLEAALDDHPGFAVGLQLQWDKLKAFCSPFPYPQVANDDQHRTVIEVLEAIRSAFHLGEHQKPSKQGTRGFRSFTIAKLPSGRNHDEWVKSIEPYRDLMVKEFRSVQPLSDPKKVDRSV